MSITFNKFLLISLLFLPLFLSAAGPTVLSAEQEALLLTLPPDQRDSVKSKIGQAQEEQEEIEEIFEERRLLIERPELKDLESQGIIDIIAIKRLNFGSLFMEGYNQIIWKLK